MYSELDIPNADLRVLLIEDNPADARLIKEILAKVRDVRFTLEWVDELHRGLDCLAAGGFDAMLLDLSLPDSHGIDPFKTAYARAPHVPIIVLTDPADEALGVKAVREGAQDYLINGQVDSSFLVRALLYAIERRQVEQEFRLQSAALASAANAIVITDREGTITWVNPAFTHLTGYAAREALGQNLRFLKSGQHDRSFYQSLWETVLSGRVWRGEIINRRKDGTLFTEEQTITPVRDERGEISHFIAIKQDVTERKQVESRLHIQAAELATKTERLEALATLSRAVIASLDLQQVLNFVVEAAVRLFGGSMVRLWLWDEDGGALRLAASVGDPNLIVYTQQVLRPGEGTPGLAFARRQVVAIDPRSMGHEWAHAKSVGAFVAVPLLISERCVGVLTAARRAPESFREEELTLLASFAAQAAIAIENARLYEEQRLAARELESTVATRTEQLRATNARLHEALRSAEEASESKSRFLAAMSHELRTPLNAIIGFSELLEDQQFGALNAKQQRYVGHVQASGHHLLNLINDILDLAKVEADRLGLEPAPLDLPESLRVAVDTFRPQAETKEIECHLFLDACPPTIVADPVRFKQILLNLLSNAVKFTESGSVRVAARLVQGSEVTVHGREAGIYEPREEPVDLVEITVTDTGIGIKAEDLPRLFQEFTQLDASLARRHQGTGLGLALTKKLVELHGGSIHAQSPGEGKGSTFTIVFPLDGPGAEPPPSEIRAAIAESLMDQPADDFDFASNDCGTEHGKRTDTYSSGPDLLFLRLPRRHDDQDSRC